MILQYLTKNILRKKTSAIRNNKTSETGRINKTTSLMTNTKIKVDVTLNSVYKINVTLRFRQQKSRNHNES